MAVGSYDILISFLRGPIEGFVQKFYIDDDY